MSTIRPLDPAIIARRDELKAAHTAEAYALLVTPHKQIITNVISVTQKPLADVALALCQQVMDEGGNIMPVLAAYADIWDLQNSLEQPETHCVQQSLSP